MFTLESVLYAFIDESYTADRYYVAAIIVDEKHLAEVREALAAARGYAAGFGVTTEGIEYHAHSIMTGCDGWEPVKGKPRAAIAIYGDVLRRLSGLPVKLIVRGVDVARLNARYRYPEAPYAVALRHLLEQIDLYARRAKDVAVIIADEIQGQASHIAQTMTYQVKGTGGYKPSKLQQIEMPIHYGKSHESPGLQSVDLAVYLYRRLDAHVETNRRTAAKVAELWESLAPIRYHVWRWDP